MKLYEKELKELMINDNIFNYFNRNIEFYSDKEAFSNNYEIIFTFLKNKNIKIFKENNL
jgi:hypothetical protein